jgi:p-hydroxybenzoate 3-monooxygenase
VDHRADRTEAIPVLATQVGIVGAGPAGLMLAHLLRLQGISSVVLETRSREYVEHRVRAGVLEQGSVDLLERTGAGERMRREGLVHHGIQLRFANSDHHVDFRALTGGRGITVYGQQELVKDLINLRLGAGEPIYFEVSEVALRDIDSERPRITFVHGGAEITLDCDAVAGCDGFHGISRATIPEAVLTAYEREYPFAWLGILATVAPSSEELIYCYHERGFALLSMRSPTVSRLYLQVPADERIDDWSDSRIWAELQTRFALDGWTLRDGPITEKAISALRSYVVEPMQYGRLYLAGDAAHIVPPTGAKGMNLALRDVSILADALTALYRTGDTAPLDGYSAQCLRRVWRAQHFSWWMTSMLHRFPDSDAYQAQLQLAQLAYTVHSRAAATSLAENYVGYEWGTL